MATTVSRREKAKATLYPAATPLSSRHLFILSLTQRVFGIFIVAVRTLRLCQDCGDTLELYKLQKADFLFLVR